MNRRIRISVLVFFIVTLFLTLSFSVGAEVYEPDTSSSEVYTYDTSECNRTLKIRCVDEIGNLLKEVNFHVKTGEETYAHVSLYGYRPFAFSSDQGLWETCKLMWTSGGSHCYGSADVKYHFRTALSMNTMTATVVMRKFDDVTVTVRHYKEALYGTNLAFHEYVFETSHSQLLNSGDYISTSANSYEGFSLKSEYQSNVSGNFSYSWLGKYENCPSLNDSMKWEIQKSALDEEYGEYTEYSEDQNGTLGYIYNRTFYIDYLYDVNMYTVTFHPNGGNGEVPGAIVWYYGYDRIIPKAPTPERSGYLFKGWSISQRASKADYFPNDSITVGLDTVLYAVWERDDYDFSVSALTVSQVEELFPNDTVTVSVRSDNWDRNDAYEDIPISLYYDGTLFHTQYVDFKAYGIAYVKFNVCIGSSAGNHKIEIRINWEEKDKEVNSKNNMVCTEINVLSDSYDFSVEALTGNAQYREGHEVITGFLVYNNSERMVLPNADANIIFTAYYYCDQQEVVITSQIWNDVVIPVGESNLVYFRWTVPDGLEGNAVYCKCTVNFDGRLKEGNLADNTTTLSTVIAPRQESQTQNPTYEAQVPNGFTNTSVPNTKAGTAVWSVWVYEQGTFVKKTYGIRANVSSPVITPGSTCDSAYYSDGKWTMKSGYGITLDFDSVTVGSLSGYTMPLSNAYTGAQSIYATFPEYRYVSTEGEYRALEFADGAWRFIKNESADGNERLHYIPVWFEDGPYIVSVTVTDIWTPIGMITAVRSSNTVLIDGNIFDDFYVGG